jgi:hypothetical protein
MERKTKPRWAEFADYVASLIAILGVDSRVWNIVGKTATLKELVGNYRLLEAIYDNAVQSMINEFPESETFPSEGVDDISLELLPIRLREIMYFVHECHLSSETMEMIPFPEKPHNEILVWFRNKWWHQHGIRRACQTHLPLLFVSP